MKSGKIDLSQIELVLNRNVFYPGEQLQGQFRLKLNRKMDMDYIEIECIGKSNTEWTVKRQEEEREWEDEYESKEKLLKLEQKVFGDGHRTTNPAGEHVYPFCFDLPAKLPSSFEGQYGQIRYKLKARIKKSWKKDLKLKKMFVVNEVIDTNNSMFRGGPGDNTEKTLGCLCCASGPLTFSANLDRGGYCPGESILITANVGNNTSRELPAVTAELIQHVTFIAKLKGDTFDSKDERGLDKTVSRIDNPAIPEGGSMDWKSQPLLVPPLPPTMSSSKYININYLVRLSVDVPMAFDLELKLPVTIGTVPYLPVYNEPPPDEKPLISQKQYEPKAPPMGPPPVTFLGYPDMAPYMYSQVLDQKPIKLQKGDEKWKYHEKDYVPVYTFSSKDMRQPEIESYDKSPSPVLDDRSADGNLDQMPPIE